MKDVEEFSRGYMAGHALADTLVEFCNLMYNKDTALRVLSGLLTRLKERMEDF